MAQKNLSCKGAEANLLGTSLFFSWSPWLTTLIATTAGPSLLLFLGIPMRSHILNWWLMYIKSRTSSAKTRALQAGKQSVLHSTQWLNSWDQEPAGNVMLRKLHFVPILVGFASDLNSWKPVSLPKMVQLVKWLAAGSGFCNLLIAVCRGSFSYSCKFHRKIK